MPLAIKGMQKGRTFFIAGLDKVVKSLFTCHCEEQSDETIS